MQEAGPEYPGAYTIDHAADAEDRVRLTGQYTRHHTLGQGHSERLSASRTTKAGKERVRICSIFSGLVSTRHSPETAPFLTGS